MLAGAAAALHTVAGARTPTVASDSAAAAASAAGRFNVQQTLSNPYFLIACLPDSWSRQHKVDLLMMIQAE